jgi:GT2 family glycosyltransferase
MRLSVVIPTRNRVATLERSLTILHAQRIEPSDVELIVVDNASSDATPSLLDGLEGRGRLELRVIQHETPGASGARNAGIAAARGEILLFLGDDTAPAQPDLLTRHLELHRERPTPTYAVLGRVAWAEHLEVTPLMRWLELGPQFAYAVMDPGPVGPEHFYTAHISVKASLLESDRGFDQRLTVYFEDTELASRLFRRGLVLDYHPELLVFHDHVITLASWLERQERAGRSGRRVHQLRDIDDRLVPLPRGWRWSAARALAGVAGHPQSEWRRLPGPLRARLYAAAHYAAYARGFKKGDGP